ncbi:hypothetical protein Tco_1300909 [Tanacetum coccineum]
MGTIRFRWGSKGSWGECSTAKSRITCDNTNGNITLSEAQGVSLLITFSVRVRVIPGIVYHDLYLGGKALVERENAGFDLTKSDLCPSFVEDLSAKGVDLCVADSRTEMDFRSFIMEGVDGEFNFLSEGGLDEEGNSHSIRTRKLMSTLSKARASCDSIRERKVKKDKGQVDKLYSEYCKLILEEKKWVNYEQTLSVLRIKVEGLESEREWLNSSVVHLLQEIDSLRQDKAAVVSKVVPRVATELVRSDKMGLLVAKLIKVAMFYGRSGDDLATASYLFIAEATADLYATIEQLLSKKPRSYFDYLGELSYVPIILVVAHPPNLGEGLEYSEPLAKNDEYSFGELLPIIEDDYLGYSESAHDMFPYEFPYMLPSCGYQWLYFDLFCEVDNGYDKEPLTSWWYWYWPYNVDPPLGERP